MTSTVGRGGRNAPLFLLLFALPAAAGPESELALCAAQSTDALKLACFEALAAKYGEAPDDPAPAAASVPPPGDEPAPAETPAAAPPARLDDSAGRAHLERAAPAASAADAFVATVERVTVNRGNRRLYFDMANGQVWRQMEPGFFPYPKDGPFDVEIRQGVLGDYQMRVDGEGRMTRIVRVK